MMPSVILMITCLLLSKKKNEYLKLVKLEKVVDLLFIFIVYVCIITNNRNTIIVIYLMTHLKWTLVWTSAWWFDKRLWFQAQKRRFILLESKLQEKLSQCSPAALGCKFHQLTNASSFLFPLPCPTSICLLLLLRWLPPASPLNTTSNTPSQSQPLSTAAAKNKTGWCGGPVRGGPDAGEIVLLQLEHSLCWIQPLGSVYLIFSQLWGVGLATAYKTQSAWPRYNPPPPPTPTRSSETTHTHTYIQ